MKLDGYLLGIDPSTACGFAVLRDDGSRVRSGVWRLHPRAHQGAGGRFTNLVAQLDSILRCFPSITSVAYEVPGRFDTQAAYLAVYGLVAHIESWCEHNGLHYAAFAPAEVKRAAGCKGNADKTDVACAIASRFDIELIELSPDEADALATAIAGLVELGCIPPLVLTPEAAPKKRAKKNTDAMLDDFYGEPT
jgi:Holliday junction resolvasome RuvABC endonuclease subunit